MKDEMVLSDNFDYVYDINDLIKQKCDAKNVVDDEIISFLKICNILKMEIQIVKFATLVNENNRRW